MDPELLRLICVVLLVFGLSAPTFSAPLPTPVFETSKRHQTFALNNLTFALYHEVGHLLISEFNLPVLGKEEDAADNIATMLLLAKQAGAANQALIDSATGWQSWSLVNSTTDVEPSRARLEFSALAGSHSPDSLRAGQLGCLLVGSRREVFANIGLELGLNNSDTKQDTCARNLGQIIASWLTLKSRFIPTGPSPHPVKIVYEEAPGFDEMAKLMRSANILESVVNSVLTHYDLPRPVTLRAASCGSHNAYYDPMEAELLICYELGQFYLDMAGAMPS